MCFPFSFIYRICGFQRTSENCPKVRFGSGMAQQEPVPGSRISAETAVSMSFSANLSAYSDMPSFLSQSAICIAATKVGRGRVFGHGSKSIPLAAMARLVKKQRGAGRGTSFNYVSTERPGFQLRPAIKDAARPLSADRELSADVETEMSAMAHSGHYQPDSRWADYPQRSRALELLPAGCQLPKWRGRRHHEIRTMCAID